MPQKEAGIRIDPPPSVPKPIGPMPLATWAPAPPLEPPDVISGFHGFLVTPVKGDSVTPFHPNSGVVVLPKSIAPAARRRATSGASSFQGPAGSTVSDPLRVGMPRVTIRSLMLTGTPSKGPWGAPASQRAVDSAAALCAPSRSRKQKALSLGLRFSIRARMAPITSVGYVSPDLLSAISESFRSGAKAR